MRSTSVCCGLGLAFLLGGCGAEAPADEASEGASVDELREIKTTEIAGSISLGTQAPHDYVGPGYRALSFEGQAGERIEAWVRATSGKADAKVWISDGSKAIAANDDESKTTKDSAVQVTLPATGMYYVVFREKVGRKASFMVSLGHPVEFAPSSYGKKLTAHGFCGAGHTFDGREGVKNPTNPGVPATLDFQLSKVGASTVFEALSCDAGGKECVVPETPLESGAHGVPGYFGQLGKARVAIPGAGLKLSTGGPINVEIGADGLEARYLGSACVSISSHGGVQRDCKYVSCVWTFDDAP